MRFVLRSVVGLCLLSCALVTCAAETTGISALWGKNGEKWEERGRLPDFSFAGYHRGETTIPNVPAVASVKDFGAIGDGKHDDTDAFKQAIARTDRGAIEIPPGRYLLTDILDIRKGNLVLRGAGPGKTTLYFPKQLNDLRPNMGATTSGRPTSNYSWSGGFLWVRGSFQSSELAKVTEPAQRGDKTLAISSTDALRVGQTIEVEQRDDKEDTLAAHLYGNQPGDTKLLLGRTRSSLTAQITRIDGSRITLDRALRCDIKLRWRPRILRFEPTVREVGIESLTFEFPIKPYEGHFTELGHNAIALNSVADCWVRDVEILHPDSGIFCSGRFNTLSGITLRSDRPVDKSLKSTGHHGVTLGGDDNLLTQFRYEARFVHDITFGASSAGNVVSDGSGVDLAFDHHKRAPYANLFTNIDVGLGTRIWRSGGGAALGKHSAAWETFWNIRAERPQSWPPAAFGPDLMNLVGLTTNAPSVLEKDGKWFEAIDPRHLIPQNLHEAQLKRRLAK